MYCLNRKNFQLQFIIIILCEILNYCNNCYKPQFMKPLNPTTTPTAGSLTSIIPAKTYHGISDPGTGGVVLEPGWQVLCCNIIYKHLTSVTSRPGTDLQMDAGTGSCKRMRGQVPAVAAVTIKILLNFFFSFFCFFSLTTPSPNTAHNNELGPLF